MVKYEKLFVVLGVLALVAVFSLGYLALNEVAFAVGVESVVAEESSEISVEEARRYIERDFYELFGTVLDLSGVPFESVDAPEGHSPENANWIRWIYEKNEIPLLRAYADLLGNGGFIIGGLAQQPEKLALAFFEEWLGREVDLEELDFSILDRHPTRSGSDVVEERFANWSLAMEEGQLQFAVGLNTGTTAQTFSLWSHASTELIHQGISFNVYYSVFHWGHPRWKDVFLPHMITQDEAVIMALDAVVEELNIDLRLISSVSTNLFMNENFNGEWRIWMSAFDLEGNPDVTIDATTGEVLLVQIHSW